MRTISAREFFRKANYYYCLVNSGETVIIRSRNGDMLALTPMSSDFARKQIN